MLERFIGAAALALSASCSTFVDSRMEGLVRDALPRLVGPAARYDVRVSGSNIETSSFDRVHVVGSRVARADAPVIDRVELELQHGTIDRQTKRLTALEAASGEVRLRTADLADYLQRRWLDDPVVRFQAPDRIIVTGVPRIGELSLPLRGGAEFRGRVVAQGAQLRLRVDMLRLGDAEAPALLRALVQRVANPLFDVSAYPVPERFDSVAVDGDVLVIGASGSALGKAGRR